MDLMVRNIIDKTIVEKVDSFCGIDVYSPDTEEDESVLYFVKGSKVVKKLTVRADCGQNMGYISSVEFKDLSDG